MASDTSKTLALVACGVATVSVLTILLVGAYRIFRLHDAKREPHMSAALTPNRTRTVSRRSTPANLTLATPPANSFENYGVDVEEFEELTVCKVTFNSLPSTSEIAAGILRNEMERLVKDDNNREILGVAFNEAGDALADREYGGPLIYKPHLGQILTEQEDSGLKTTRADRGSYFVKTVEGTTAKGIIPNRRWYSVSIVFSCRPSLDEAKAASVAEIGRLKSRGQDVDVFVFDGDKANGSTWKQVMGPNGKFLVVEYDAATKGTSANWEVANPLSVETMLHEGMSREELEEALGIVSYRTMRMGHKESYRWLLKDGRVLLTDFENGALADWQLRVLASPRPDPMAVEEGKAKLTMRTYEAILNGMFYDDVVRILGSPGILADEDGIYQSYLWEDSGSYAFALVSFKNGKVIGKLEGGLEFAAAE